MVDPLEKIIIMSETHCHPFCPAFQSFSTPCAFFCDGHVHISILIAPGRSSCLVYISPVCRYAELYVWTYFILSKDSTQRWTY